MPIATFETPEGDDVEIDADELTAIRPGAEADTVTVELDDGSEVIVVATELEVAAELGLDPVEIAAEDDDEDGDDREEL